MFMFLEKREETYIIKKNMFSSVACAVRVKFGKKFNG